MIDRRAYLFLLLVFVTTTPALAQSADSAVVSGEQLQTLQTTLEGVNESMDGLNKRPRQTGAEASSAEGQANLADVLFVFLAIAIVFEAAMSAIFDWRVFIRYFEGRGVKTLVLVGTALVVCFNYNLDILHQILDVLDQSRPKQGIGKIITALLISGGSSAVFRVYSNLGLRNPAERTQKAQEMRQEMADAKDNASENDTTETQS